MRMAGRETEAGEWEEINLSPCRALNNHSPLEGESMKPSGICEG